MSWRGEMTPTLDYYHHITQTVKTTCEGFWERQKKNDWKWNKFCHFSYVCSQSVCSWASSVMPLANCTHSNWQSFRESIGVSSIHSCTL